MRPATALHALAGGLILLLATGCSSPWKREQIYSRSGVALYREYKLAGGEKAALGYRHPVEIDPEKMALILSHLNWRDSYFLGLKKPVDLHVFNPTEVQASAKALCIALHAMGPDDRLRFLVTRSNWTEAFLGTQGTSGVMFSAKEGILEIAFDRIQERIAGGEGGEPMDVTFNDPLEVTSADPILPSGAIALRVEPETGVEYPRWVEVKIDQVASLAAAPAAPGTAPPGGSAAPAQTPKPAPTVATPASGAPHDTTPATASTGAPPGQAAPPADPYQRVRERIEKLKRLRADGAITEEEYAKEFEKAISEL
jgi:hypothetical protein